MRSLLLSVSALIVSFAALLAGNSLQFVVLGLRAEIEGFSVEAMGVITACYFVGFGLGSFLCPKIIDSAGHIRSFAALASVISGVTLAHPLLPDPVAWGAMRLVIGFCFSGLYMVVESWLNARASNELRGRVLSIYGTAAFAGYACGPLLTGLGSAEGFVLFIVASMLVSFALVPVTLTRASAPVIEPAGEGATEAIRYGFWKLYKETPLGVVGIVLIGAVQGSFLGLGSVFGSQIGLEPRWVSAFMTLGLFAGLCLQYPIGWLSDRLDRRLTIMAVGALGGAFCLAGYLALTAAGSPGPILAIGASVLAGTCIFPLYAVILAYTNDRLPQSSLVAAAAAVALCYSIGSSLGPPFASALMSGIGAPAFFLALAILMTALAVFAGYRSLRRPAPKASASEETAPPVVAASPGTVPLDPSYEETETRE